MSERSSISVGIDPKLGDQESGLAIHHRPIPSVLQTMVDWLRRVPPEFTAAVKKVLDESVAQHQVHIADLKLLIEQVDIGHSRLLTEIHNNLRAEIKAAVGELKHHIVFEMDAYFEESATRTKKDIDYARDEILAIACVWRRRALIAVVVFGVISLTQTGLLIALLWRR
jgi:hypothetical protein